MMRIALFTETFLPKIDGIVTVTCLLLDHLAKRGIDSVIVAPRLTNNDIPQYAQTRVIRVNGVTLPIYPELKMGPPTLSTYRELQAFKPDLVHIIHPVLIGTIGLFMGKWLKVPRLASFHLDIAEMSRHHNLSIMTPPMNLYARWTFNAADYTLAPSRQVQKHMYSLGIRKVGLWGRGVDSERFNPCYRSTKMRELLSDGHPEDLMLLYVGRLSAEKQLDRIRAVLEQVPGTRLALIGSGPEQEILKRHFAGYPVKFMGYMSGEPLSQAYASADLFVFPSALETFGLVVTEAMAAGLPVVASRVGGVGDVVEEGVTGYTFEIGDTAALVEGVRQIAASPENRAEMGHAARAFAETQTWDVMMDGLLDVYMQMIEDYRAKSTRR